MFFFFLVPSPSVHHVGVRVGGLLTMLTDAQTKEKLEMDGKKGAKWNILVYKGQNTVVLMAENGQQTVSLR